MGFNNFMKAIQGILGAATAKSDESSVGVKDRICWHPRWEIEKYDTDESLKMGIPDEVLVINGNLLLNEGITELLKLLAGNGTATAFSAANAQIGVGNSNAAESASQTGLQGASKAFAAMDDGYPAISNQTITYQGTFGADDANFAWEECTVVNGADDTAVNLNRKTQPMGTKLTGTTWVARLIITLS